MKVKKIPFIQSPFFSLLSQFLILRFTTVFVLFHVFEQEMRHGHQGNDAGRTLYCNDSNAWGTQTAEDKKIRQCAKIYLDNHSFFSGVCTVCVRLCVCVCVCVCVCMCVFIQI